jgi:hypothetical protein
MWEEVIWPMLAWHAPIVPGVVMYWLLCRFSRDRVHVPVSHYDQNQLDSQKAWLLSLGAKRVPHDGWNPAAGTLKGAA